MKLKTKQKLKSRLFPVFQWATLGQLPPHYAENAWKFYIKFLEIFFMITTSITFTTAFVWFFPIYLKRGYDFSIVILLCILILQLRYSGIKINKDDGDE